MSFFHILIKKQVQFVAIFTHQFQLLWTDCDYPKGFMVWIGLHGIMFLFLFSDFYKQSYIKKKEKVKVIKKESENGKVYLNGDSKSGVLVSINFLLYFLYILMWSLSVAVESRGAFKWRQLSQWAYRKEWPNNKWNHFKWFD